MEITNEFLAKNQFVYNKDKDRYDKIVYDYLTITIIMRGDDKNDWYLFVHTKDDGEMIFYSRMIRSVELVKLCVEMIECMFRMRIDIYKV